MIPEWHMDCNKCEYDPDDCDYYDRCEWHDRIMRHEQLHDDMENDNEELI